MRTMLAGLAGWARMEEGRNEAARSLDTGLTLVGTLLLATTWMLLHSSR